MKKIQEILNESKNIAIFVHTKADPDAIGSAGAFCLSLLEQGKNAFIILQEKLPLNLSFLKIKNILYTFEPNKYDLLIALDVGSKNLLGKFENKFINFKNTLCFDHHLVREQVGNFEYVNSFVSSTCELLFTLFKRLGYAMTPDIATSLYAGIVGDTGRFMHTNSLSSTFKVASKLLRYGANLDLVNTNLYKNDSYNRLQLMRYMIKNSTLDGDVVCSYLTLEDYKNAKCNPILVYNLIDVLFFIKEANIGYLVSENCEGNCKVSLRSKVGYNASKIAENFGGGGHKYASGIKKINGKPDVVCKEILQFIKNNRKEIDL